MARLKLHLVDRADFVKFHDPNITGGGLFVPGTDLPPTGQRVTVEVVFQGGPRVLLHGSVAWKRTQGDARTRPGVGVAIEPAERSKLNYVIGYVRGGMIDVREKKRLPVRLRVTYTGAQGRRINFTRDINHEGAFVRTSELLEVGAHTVLLISPPGGFKPIEVKALVARQQDDGVERGIGVRFEFSSDAEKEKFHGFLRKLEADYLDGRLPDDALL